MMTVTLRNEVSEQLDALRNADIIIGILSYNNARTINHVVRAVQAGWAKNTIVRALMENILRMTVRVQKTITKTETAS
jgi:hypothetical protein